MNDTDVANIPSPIQLSREQILRATSGCLHELGYDATTIRQIAGRLDCAVGSIYRYFKDKRELLSAVTQQTLEPVAAMVESGQSVEATAQLYHRIAGHAPETYRLMFWLACESGAATRLPPVVARILDGWASQFGTVRALAFWSVLHGCVLMGRPFEDVQKLQSVQDSRVDGRPAAAAPQSAKAPETAATPNEPRIVVTMTAPPAPQPVEAPSEARAEDVVLL